MQLKNLRIFRLADARPLDIEQLQTQLEQRAFVSGSSQDPVSIGWAEPRHGEGLAYGPNGQILLSVRSEKKLLPSSVINQVAQAKARDIEEEQGYRPGRKQMREIKEQVITELMPRAFSVHRDTSVWIDPVNRWLVVDTASNAVGDEVMGLIAKTFDPFPALPLYTELSPAAAMTSWLAEDEAPAGFSIDQDTELRSTSERRATVRYVRHSVDTNEVRNHIEAGKQCTRLALTWNDKISFVLDDGLALKRVTPLDVLKDQNDTISGDDTERFNSDMALMTAELAALISDLVEALGGEKVVV
ncbi:recombination-associated protein RdgC [Paenalcaligenes niemegkensis]|uniref:recombination-associated protein RdgC n=1 Tax=Paenalcaligenes niemegkensis TaxID=2895469 RepID=UPI001EE791D3|nr:recombination-associated protein RdgC [Paenalcaligenes niemegkensis]MCQ9618343.1 recombination-associated protein RdgC [Paenalcaligenes niemegkensis]